MLQEPKGKVGPLRRTAKVISGCCQDGSSCLEEEFVVLWSWACIASTNTTLANPETAVVALAGSCYERRWEAECSCTLIT